MLSKPAAALCCSGGSCQGLELSLSAHCADATTGVRLTRHPLLRIAQNSRRLAEAGDVDQSLDWALLCGRPPISPSRKGASAMTNYKVVEVDPEGSLQSAERELVEPPAGQVRIRVEACGVCHSDSFTVQPHDPEKTPAIPGHEIVGVVDASGPGVEGWATGQRVGVGFLGGHCGVCQSCRMGNFVACTNQPQTGMDVDGGYAEVVFARPSGLVAVPDDLTSAEAAPLLCAGFTTFNALLKAHTQPDDLVAIQGIGGLGHLGIQYAAKMGLRVVAVARGTAKEELARELGAHHYIDSTATDPGEALSKLGGAQAVIATAAAGDISPLLNGLATGGRLVVVGASDEPVKVTPVQLVFGDVRIMGSLTGSASQNENNLRFATDQRIRAMIETRPMSEASEAYERMSSGGARFRMVLTM
ncbi:alcohol dehydrogenase catalytic domain-containing protein [Streptomyces sp. NPDC058685]|uniref:alcohol dehydrogenase catalytic domain-containing protein n=1 Tax=Streptomyces sp. NPDC058685 TaxID=3346598 RepID=UPI00366366BC